MGKAGRWLRSFLMGWREKKGGTEPSPLPTETRTVLVSGPAPKERRRWSFQRSAEAGKGMNSPDLTAPRLVRRLSASEIDRKSHAMAVAVATAAAADAAVAASQAAAAARAAATAVRMTNMITGGGGTAVEEAAAIKIQAIFRSYLARRALCALKGLVKLQAMVRGHLVRKQATATLRSMQALVMAQARARAQRIRMVEAAHAGSQQQSSHRRAHEHLYQQSYEMDRSSEENVKIVEMDHGESRGSSKSRNSYSTAKTERKDDRLYYCGVQEQYQQFSPAPSTLADISPGVNSKDLEEISFATTQSNRQYFSSDVFVPDATQASFGYPLFPKYMANTESSRAKTRSHSAPKQRPDSYERQSSRRRSSVEGQRPDSYERQSSRRRSSVEGRNIPKGVKIQRSSSNGSTMIGHQHPSSLKLDKSTMSLKDFKDSECGSTSSVLTDTKYCRSVVTYEVRMY